MNNETDGLFDLASALAIRRSGWHRMGNSDNEYVAVFPIQAKNESEWEARAMAQSAEAERLEAATRPAPKPMETGIRRNIVRGD